MVKLLETRGSQAIHSLFSDLPIGRQVQPRAPSQEWCEALSAKGQNAKSDPAGLLCCVFAKSLTLAFTYDSYKADFKTRLVYEKLRSNEGVKPPISARWEFTQWTLARS